MKSSTADDDNKAMKKCESVNLGRRQCGSATMASHAGQGIAEKTVRQRNTDSRCMVDMTSLTKLQKHVNKYSLAV